MFKSSASLTNKVRFPSVFTNIVINSKPKQEKMSEQEIQRHGGIQIHGEVIINKDSNILLPQQNDYENPRVTLGVIGSRIVRFCEEQINIVEYIDAEFWIYEESQSEKGYQISLNNSICLLIIMFPTYREQQQWSEIIMKFTVKLGLKDDFSFQRCLGSGVSSKVNLATEKGKLLGKQFAVKTIKKTYFKESSVNFESVIRETRIQRHLTGCDKVMQMFAIYEDLQHVHLVLEYLRGGTLRSYFSKFPQLNEQLLKKVMSQLITSLQQIHERGVVHRDIKLDNILVGNFDEENIEVKIADFGLSDQIIYPMTMLHQRCGSPGYIAPEILRSEGYNFKADIFSMGSVFYNILAKKGLFEGMFKGGLKEFLIANRDCNLAHVPARLKESVPGAKEITIKMLAIKPVDRPTAEQLLSMPWIAQYDYSIMSVDEHIENLLVQVPCLVQVWAEDNMQSILIGNFNFHDPKSIQSGGASFIQSCHNGSPSIKQPEGPNKKFAPMSPHDQMRLKPHHFGQFGKKNTNENMGSRLNLSNQKLLQRPISIQRNASDLNAAVDFHIISQHALGQDKDPQRPISMIYNQGFNSNMQNFYSNQNQRPPNNEMPNEKDECSMQAEMPDFTERKNQVQTVYCSIKVGKYKKESYQMKEVIANPQIKQKRFFVDLDDQDYGKKVLHTYQY
ncbi:serine threonine protein kinase [Stylonychia lemnae]|uniref:Serine threonine protein kinase n=1 Tax=Stylonychia lemnae TaxID=5949 RepID=A0A078B629_STYLE|nr:serine threonine protein kinase [Stylonychia lemnae]|eukprot:CDW88963.1 serine threonine protein kinase [Stylonychia lemnae]